MSVFVKKSLFAIIIFLCANFSVIFCQTFPYINYSTKDGMCNPNVYYVLQDKKGYIWFATNNGLSRFNGINIKNYSVEDGLNSNSFTSIAMGEDSTLYFANYDKGINIYREGKFSNYFLHANDQILVHSMILRRDTIFYYSLNYLNYIYKNEVYPALSVGTLGVYNRSKPDYLKIYKLFEWEISNEKKLCAATDKGIYELKSKSFVKINIDNLNDSVFYCASVDFKGNCWLSGDGKLFKISNNIAENISIPGVKGKIYKMYSDSYDNIWLHPIDNGLFVYKNGEVIDIGKQININRTAINCIYEDRDGNIWVATSGKGVYCFYNLYINNYYETNGLSSNNILTLFFSKKNNLFIGTFSGLNIYNNGKIQSAECGYENQLTKLIFDIKSGIKHIYIGSSYKTDFVKKNLFEEDVIYSTSTSICENSENEIIKGGNFNKIFFYDISKNLYAINKSIVVIGEDSMQVKITDIEKHKDGKIWIGTSKGLCSIDGDKKTYFKDNLILNSGINQIKFYDDKELWVVGEKGIGYVNTINNNYDGISKFNDIDLSSSTSITFDKEGYVWIGNLKGLIRFKKFNNFQLIDTNSILFIDDKSGLPSNEVHSITFGNNNELWVGTLYGLSNFNLDNLNKIIKKPNEIKIESIELKDSIIKNANDKLLLKSNQNNLLISFSNFDFKSFKNTKYSYRLDEKDWYTNETGYIELLELESGDHKFEIRTVNSSNNKSDITSILFKIETPFWRTIYFRLSVYLTTILLVIYIVSKKISFIKKRHKEILEKQNSISELKHSALSATLNPHFVFNTLNSIQHFINIHNKEDANNYLVNFARLIRMNLELAGNTFVTLESELERLELYLNYEKLRFGSKLEYVINLGEGINKAKLFVPNMFLQPFVENSIWHGLLPKTYGGSININIYKQTKRIENVFNEVIEFEIRDDGVGYSNSLQNKKETHISKGMSIIKERLELLSPLKEKSKHIKIEDRSDNKGTIVSITLVSPQYKYNN